MAGISGFGYAFNSLQDSQGLLPTAVSTILLQTEERIFQTASWWKIPFLPSSRRFSTLSTPQCYEGPVYFFFFLFFF
jgi:hypothetical protein